MSQGPVFQNPRFVPMFWTQFLGAFNDNFFKNAMVILITYGSGQAFGLGPAMLVTLSGAILMLPFFLFSATAGQLADKYEKARLIRIIKIAEICIMLFGAAAFLAGSIEALLILLFFMGTQSAFFGPIKYSILPRLLDQEDLVGGNAWVEMGTYLAILGGTIVGGILVSFTNVGIPIVAFGVVAVAILGYLTSRRIPNVAPENPDLKVQWDPIFPTWDIIRITMKNKVVYRAILAITWFWGFGVVLLAGFPTYTKELLHANESIATLFLAMFSVGIGFGSFLCERLSKHRLELGLVPIGSIGMTVFTIDLFLVGQPWVMPADAPLMGFMDFVTTFSGIRILFDLFGIATFGGMYIVPLYTLLQQRSAPGELSRVIAANNIINAFFMVLASVGLMVLQGMGLAITSIFLVLAIINALVAVYIYTVVPEFMLRFCAWILSNVMYRIKVEGLEKVPREGPCIVVCNHVSFVDWLIIGGAIKRPVRFVMDKNFSKLPIIGFMSRQARVIPIASKKRDPEMLEKAYETISQQLDEGWVVCIFPEGNITRNGNMNTFLPGVERMLERNPCPVVPVAMNGMWGSWFSRKDGSAMAKPPRRFWSRVWITIGEPVAAEEANAEHLQDLVTELWSRNPAA